jgi:hypothetical protein
MFRSSASGTHRFVKACQGSGDPIGGRHQQRRIGTQDQGAGPAVHKSAGAGGNSVGDIGRGRSDRLRRADP